MTRQIRVSCSRAIFANGAIGMCLAEVNIATSNNNVKPLPGRAHGTFTRCTPWSAHRTRGTRAARYPWCSKKSRCRQVLSTVSCTAQLVWAQPCSGHPNREPRGKSSPRSSRPASGSNSTETTCHGTARPNAAPNISFKSNPSSRPTNPITARRHHRNQSQNGRRSTRPPTRNSEEPENCIRVSYGVSAGPACVGPVAVGFLRVSIARRVTAWGTARGLNGTAAGSSPPDGREGQSACSSATSTSSQTARASPRSLPDSPFVCPRGPILGRIGPCDRGRKPPLTCGDAVEPPIGIEPMTYSLRGSYTTANHSAGRHLPPQPRQFSSVSMARSRSCMPKIRPRQRLPRRLNRCGSKGGCQDAHTYWFWRAWDLGRDPVGSTGEHYRRRPCYHRSAYRTRSHLEPTPCARAVRVRDAEVLGENAASERSVGGQPRVPARRR